MKKLIISFLIALCLIALASCASPTEVTGEETEKGTDIHLETPAETFAETLTEATTEIMTETPTEESTEAPVETETEPIPEGTTVSDEEFLQSVMEKLLAEGHDMEQLEFSGEKKDVYSYTAILNARVFRPGDTLEVVLQDLTYCGQEYSLEKMYGILEIPVAQLFPGGGGMPYYPQSEDYATFSLTIPENVSRGVYWFDIYYNGEDYVDVCPIIIY